MIVLDTHCLVWASDDDPRLGGRARKRIADEQALGGVLVPAIALWEIAMLVARGRMPLNRPVADWMNGVLGQAGVSVAPVTPEVALDAGGLPRRVHGDPADRLIMATARATGCPLLTADEKILAHGAAGLLLVQDARR